VVPGRVAALGGYDPARVRLGPKPVLLGPHPVELVAERLQHRRHQAAGKPLWTTDKLLPEPLRNRDPSMFVCHATDTRLIPAANLDTLKSYVVRRDRANR
jgi:hypothetical protein